MEFDEVLAIGFGVFIGVMIAGIFDSMRRSREMEPEHIFTSTGRKLLVEVGESNAVSIVDAVSKTRI